MNRAYHVVCAIVRPFAAILYPTRVSGLENVPDGAALFCADHSNYVDPVLVALALGRRHTLTFMAKMELMKAPFLGWLLRLVGAFGVNRGEADIDAIRTSLRILKGGGKLLMFPEGTRRAASDTGGAKTGAVRIAAKARVPIVPIFITKNKKIFRRVHLVIGAPYMPRDERDSWERQSEELMERIYALGDGI